MKEIIRVTEILNFKKKSLFVATLTKGLWIFSISLGQDANNK